MREIEHLPRDTFLLLGAGASFGAREPRPPLGHQLADTVQDLSPYFRTRVESELEPLYDCRLVARRLGHFRLRPKMNLCNKD